MSEVKLGKKAKQYIGQILYLTERFGRIKIGKLAFYLDVSYKHLKYYVLPYVIANSDCIKIDKRNDEVIFVCNGNTDPEAKAREEADEFLREVGISG